MYSTFILLCFIVSTQGSRIEGPTLHDGVRPSYQSTSIDPLFDCFVFRLVSYLICCLEAKL